MLCFQLLGCESFSISLGVHFAPGFPCTLRCVFWPSCDSAPGFPRTVCYVFWTSCDSAPGFRRTVRRCPRFVSWVVCFQLLFGSFRAIPARGFAAIHFEQFTRSALSSVHASGLGFGSGPSYHDDIWRFRASLMANFDDYHDD